MHSDPLMKLRGRRLLAVEDDYLIATQLQKELIAAGAEVVGPVATVAEALQLAASERLDGAVVDINLGGELAYPVADVLRARRVPVVFVTGYDQSSVPAPYADIPRCEKPVGLRRIARTMFAD